MSGALASLKYPVFVAMTRLWGPHTLVSINEALPTLPAHSLPKDHLKCSRKWCPFSRRYRSQ